MRRSPTSTASIMQEQTGNPSSQTVQAEQAPRSHPILVPVRPSGSRSASAKVIRGSISNLCESPLTSRSIATACDPTDWGSLPCGSTVLIDDAAFIIVAPAVVSAEPRRNERRESLACMTDLILALVTVATVIYVKPLTFIRTRPIVMLPQATVRALASGNGP